MRRIEFFFNVIGLALLSVGLASCSGNTINGGPPLGSGATNSNGGVANPNATGGSNGFQVGSGGSDNTAGTSAHAGTAPPACGDGVLNQTGEDCDDGNTRAGDGCSGICKVEPNHSCPIDPSNPTHSLPCVVTFKCGDGVVNPGEVCDQGTFQGSPGCSADCKTQAPGYKCVAGKQCVATFSCGDSHIQTGETCDPPNPGNGCAANCQAETGWRCKPGSCVKMASCGDGIVQADQGEKCDEGTFKGSPGCSSDCLSMDATCTCTPGKACVCQAPKCGDGIVQVGEQCDDKGSAFPGCDDKCQLEKGYQCPFAGAPCVPVCGDGILVSPAEQCDPAIANQASACYSATTADATHPPCSVKPGYVCDSTGCHTTTCGDGKVEGSEGCDPATKNNDLGDGCTATCTAEPTCPKTGGACSTICGDGLVLGSEACDDGNAVSGDGCSSDCKIEAGFTCTQPPLGDTMTVPMVVRDFNAGGDFEPAAGFATGLNYANQGLVKAALDANGLKPVLQGTTGTYNGTAGQASAIASANSFAQWFNDAAPASGNTYHATLGTSLQLYLITGSTPAAYVNRFGVNGNGLTSAQYLRTHTNQCGTVNQTNHDDAGAVIPCSACYYNANCDGGVACNLPCSQHDTTPCQTDATYTGECVAQGNAWIGTFLDAKFDGNPLFFPADAIATPWSPNVAGQISGNYNPSWPTDTSKPTHNFSFTTEVRFWFKYSATQNYKLTFVGDDDVWVFINKTLAVDLGGIHTAVQGTVTFGATATTTTVTPTNVTPAPAGIVSHPNLGLTDGGVFEIAVFQVERQTKASSYQLMLGGFNASKSSCKPVCGGTNPAVSPGEECDNGAAGNCDPATATCYNKCTTSCKLGPRCGDAVVQADQGEDCDNGKNTDGYAAAGSNACTPSCKKPPSCGDGKIQLDYNEECDDGADNSDSIYGGCTTKCKFGPSCGDGTVNGDATHPESCDDGINDGTYGTCGIGCTPPPRCGDGVVQADWGEACEPSLDANCNSLCQLDSICGDGKVDPGEACDYGTALNTGDYGTCNSNCSAAPNCGDGITNGQEECDLGTDANTGEYGGCTAQCKLAPHCGDNVVSGPEECDDGPANDSATSSCTATCKKYLGLPPS
jgi:fibro-slime domain-containing protein